MRTPRLAALAVAAAAGVGAVVPPAIVFEDVAREAGLAFVHENSPTARKHLVESVPGGVALFDYDGD